jgi:hypothetical protein
VEGRKAAPETAKKKKPECDPEVENCAN